LEKGGGPMPRVEARVEIDAPLPLVYEIAKGAEEFPQFMPDVKEVKILERKGGRVVTSWVGVVREFGREIRWTEEDLWDDERHECRFRMLEGDFDRYEGVWRFFDLGEGRTGTELVVDYEINIPLIGPLIKGLIAKKMRENCQGMLEGLKQRAEERAREG